ncbi:MAG: metallophosphoesterase, partial [Thermodesulfobacteriota bacterium]
MSLFLLTFFLVYGSAHAYVFLRAKSALGFGWGTGLLLLPVLAALVCAPIVAWQLGHRGHEAAARAV